MSVHITTSRGRPVSWTWMSSISKIAAGVVVLATLACAAPGPPPTELESLPIESVSPGEPMAPGRDVSTRAPNQPARATPPPPTVPAPVPEPQGRDAPAEGDVVRVDRASLNRELQQATAISDVVGVRPNLTLRGMNGVTITSIPSGSPAARLGLRSGDVVHSINGHELDSIGSAMGAADELQGASSFTGEITRDGKRQTLRVILE